MAAQEVMEETTGGTRAVLLVEDEVLVRFDIADRFRLSGWKVIEAGMAGEAIEILNSPAVIDLVVTDVRMPGEADGLDVAKTTRLKRPNIPVIIMSGDLEFGEQHEHLADHFIAKPFPSGDIVQLADALLRERDGNSEAAR